jgi:hypothetical protein
MALHLQNLLLFIHSQEASSRHLHPETKKLALYILLKRVGGKRKTMHISRYQLHISLFLGLITFAVFSTGSETLPGSWKEYIDFRHANGDFGKWKGTGVTTGIWAGIPKGIAYETSIAIQLSADGSKIIESHQFKSKNGDLLSTGSGFVTYDRKTRKILSTYSGYDGDQVFTGVNELMSFGGTSEKWSYTETSRGQTYTVTRSVNWDSKSEKQIAYIRSKDQQSDVTRLKKQVTAQKSTLNDFYAFCDLLEGRWMVDVTLIADWPGIGLKRGEKFKGYDSFTKILDGEALEWSSVGGEGEFRAIFHWDSHSSTIHCNAYTSGGAMHHSVWWKEEEGKYALWLKRAFERDNRRLAGKAGIQFDRNARSFRFTSDNLKLGGEALDKLEDIFHKISKAR